MEEKELFEDYEIKGLELSPKLYKIFGAAAFLQLFVLFTVAQLNLLQTKACDSPYVGKVCQVLDVVSLLDTETGFSDQVYEPTEIRDAEITYIDVSRTEPPFEYPQGYFAVANPESMIDGSMMPPADFSTSGDLSSVPSSSPTLDFNQPQILPTPNSSVADQKLPESPFSFGNEDDSAGALPPRNTTRVPSYRPPRANSRVPASRQPKGKNQSPSKLPSLEGDETASKNADAGNANTNQQTAKNEANANANTAVSEEDKGKFNQKPLKDFGEKYGEQILKNEININAPFTIVVIARLSEEGKLIDPVMQAEPGSDPNMTEVAKKAIAAFGDSKLLRPIYESGGRDVKITFAQNADNLQAIIQTAAKTESDAKKLYNGVNIAIGLAKTLRKGSDEAILMEKTELSTRGNIFTINFLIPNQEKNQMIEKSLKNLKQELEQKKSQPNSVAVSQEKNARS